jgi:HAE1 family hydrophobic/amphiphilic exporter-1
MEQIEEVAAGVLPSTVSGLLTGAAKSIASTINDTLLLLLAAAVVMYIVLGILYESFIHPLTILSSIPFAGLGGILTLFIFGEPISIFSAVGFLLLIGIVKKNGIMMVDYAVEAQKEGASAENAIYDACLVRFRPIMMTTIAAIMGAIPIAIGFGDGAEMRRGLGLVIVGGLLFSQLLTLYVTPILFLIFHKLFERKGGPEKSGSPAQ